MKILLLLTILAPEALLATAANECQCVESWTSNLKSKIAGFAVKPKQYEYTGVIVGIMNSFYKPCVCTDVIRASTSITVQSPSLFTATAGVNVSDAVNNITGTLLALIPLMENFETGELLYRFEDITATYASSTPPQGVTFNIEVVLRGSNESYAPLVKEAFLAVTDSDNNGNHELPKLGLFTLMDPMVKKCTDAPDAAPTGFTRAWSGQTVPPTKAIYSCPAGQFVLPLGAGVVQCRHDSLTWSTLPTVTCGSGCGKEPPALPIYSTWTWDNTTRAIGTNITYSCINGYRSGDGKDAFSDCGMTGWRNLSKTFFCSELPCEGPISQVPAHAQANFMPNKRMAGTEVTYSCIPGYRSPNKTDFVIMCSLGNWTLLPDKWVCNNLFSYSLTDSLIGEMDLPDNELTAEEKARKLDMALSPNYFWIVTIPSIIGLIIAMVICLCCTRTDSPLFNICGGHNSDSFGYQDYLEKFGKNR